MEGLSITTYSSSCIIKYKVDAAFQRKPQLVVAGNLSPLLSHKKFQIISENNATKIIHKRCLGKIRFEKHLMLRRQVQYIVVAHLSFQST